MPLYDYKCSKCGNIFEVQQRISEEPLKYCPICKGPIKRLISAAGIVFKGSGFHVTDYRKDKTAQTTKPAEKKEEKPKTTEKLDKPASTETKSSSKEASPKK